jgi:hypothetical protein
MERALVTAPRNHLKLTSFVISIVTLVSSCSFDKKSQVPLPVLSYSEDEWATFEGRWIAKEGILNIELSLKNGSFGTDSEYELTETFESNRDGYGTKSHGAFSVYKGFQEAELGIRLHDLNIYNKNYLRFKRPGASQEEMFFLTRGNEELIPCDDNFKPVTLDRRFTLHKRSKLFTVEGYVTVENDSAEFFERNTSENWRLANLGDYDEVKASYKQLAKEKYQGIYLKGVAYSVRDTTNKRTQNALVIKQIKIIGGNPK